MKRRTNVPSPVDSLVTQVEQLQQTDSTVEDGEMVWCRATQCLWVYRQNSGLTPDGAQVVAALYGNGVWVRTSMTLGADGALFQTSWFVDPVNGSDANTGLTLATALKTDAERQRRWGSSTLVIAPTTVTYASSPPTTDKINCNAIVADGAGLLFQGTRTQVASGTFTAVTPINRGAQTPMSVTDGALVGGFTPHIGRIIRITGGARSGAYARLVKDLGAGAARVSPFGTFNPAPYGQLMLLVTPVNGDPYEVVTFPTLSVGVMDFGMSTNNAPVNGAVVQNAVTFDSLNLDGNFQGGGVFGRPVPIFIKQSILNQMVCGSDFFLVAGGGVDQLYMDPVGCYIALHAIGSLGAGWSVSNGTVDVDGDSIFQNSALGVSQDGYIRAGNVCFFDRSVADNALFVGGANGTADLGVTLLYGSGVTWGTANAGHGIKVFATGALGYTTKPTVNDGLGAGREALVGGEDTLYAAIAPNKIAANGAKFITRA